MPTDVPNMLLWYLALRHLLPVHHRMFTKFIARPSVDQVCSVRRRRRPAPTVLRPPVSELARRVEALAVSVEDKGIPTDVIYSEQELLAFYDELLSLPHDEPRITDRSPTRLSITDQDKAVVETIFSSKVQLHALDHSSLPHHVALSRLTPIIQELQASASGQGSVPVKDVPLAILSINEWRSLTRVCLSHDDPHSTRRTLELMMTSGIQLGEDHANDVLGWYATRGDVLGLEDFLQTFVKGPLTDHQRHLHIKAHEKSVPPGTIPESALSLLHSYENAGRPPPITAYSRLIAALFRTPSSPALEPERALDLFTEMTVDRRIPPTAGAYTAAILVCARSGSKVYVNEAFRLAKEMLDAHRDARGRGAFRPDSHIFGALLEGAKRIGDLGRVRWILAEMVEMTQRDPDNEDVIVNERIMTHVFHAYAAATWPLLTTQTEGDADTPTPAVPTEPTSPEPSFTHLPPQSRSEVIGEARALFSRIIRPSPDPTSSPSGPSSLPALPDVHVTPRLLVAYLSVFYAHAPLETAHEMFRKLSAEHGLAKDALALVVALERCANARRGSERAYVRSFAGDAWQEWTALENERKLTRAWNYARHIQRAYAAQIRVLALTGRLDEALACLRAFVARYPPSDVREASSTATQRPDMRSTRVLLAASNRPLVRLTTALDVQDDDVPPLLTFADIEVLHHRLVAAGDRRSLAYVKWVCKVYEGALRKRREAALQV
ncbi:hypothetical protein BGY98DRAFT_1090385 [Russula aff. rugulosa BPL654]|nr:hypothetical protein BGY98DRAFT_1090385 [Russula aff. rugulosa BPL654]